MIDLFPCPYCKGRDVKIGLECLAGFTPKHGSWLNFGRDSSPRWRGRCSVTLASKAELKSRILAYLDDVNSEPVIHTWTYKIAEAA